jgi:3-phosphoshikimate 1-carboxyvinyltransferase
VVASTRSQKTLEDAKALGLIDVGYQNPIDAVQDADLVILALPVRATQKFCNKLNPI